MRVLIREDPFVPDNAAKSWREEPLWPCSWIAYPDEEALPLVTAYRLRFPMDQAATVRVHVSADERYKLFLDGMQIGMGPERGDPFNWFYETYDLALSVGEHVIVAQVWSLGELAAMAQMSVHPGFLFAPEGPWAERLGSGRAPWEVKRISGYEFVDPAPARWREHRVRIDGSRYPWGWERGAGDGWQPARTIKRAIGRHVDWEIYKEHVLKPAMLPPMMAERRYVGTVRFVADVPSPETRAIPVQRAAHQPGEAEGWRALIHDERALLIPPHTCRRVIIDLDNYYCAYPELTVSGGAGGMVRVHWCEALHMTPQAWSAEKGNRNEIEGKYVIGIGDTFLPDGGEHRYFEPLWYQAGRYIELLVQTLEEPLILHTFRLRETRYPLEMESRFSSSEDRLARLTPILVRGIQATAHETFYDSPYYEELMYASDTRLECLTTYVMSRDDRLPRKALALFDWSRYGDGFTQARYPSRVTQIIPAWSLWSVGMVHDYAFWRGDAPFVRQLLAGARMTLEAFLRYLRPDGLLHPHDLPGWNGHMDWVPSWPAGIPPAVRRGPTSMHNWQLVYTLGLVADLEERLGDPEMAARFRRHARELVHQLENFWDEARGLYADDLARTSFCEHTQILAILSEQLPPARIERLSQQLLSAPDLERATVHYIHYLFEVFQRLGQIDALLDRMQIWYDMLALGFVAPQEKPEPSRSDCHGWSSHPLYHYFATILGIRPADLGFCAVSVRPQLGPLRQASGVLVHPRGEIAVEVHNRNGTLGGSVRLPGGVPGMLYANGSKMPIEGEIHF